MPIDSKETIRKKILKATLDISDKVNYEDVTMRDVSRAADVSLASIYAHFSSKEQLLVEMADEKLSELVAGLKDHDSHIVGTLNRLKLFTWNYLKFHETNPKISWVIYMSTNVQHWHRNLGLWKDTRALGDIFRNILVEGEAEKEVRPEINLRLVSHQYFGGLRFLVVNWLLGDRKWSLTSDTDAFAEITFQAVKNTNSERLDVRCPFLVANDNVKL
ncbi:MAG: TetR/AcrR family transcriptional regulator [Dehalococcoidia bacterium]